MTPVRVAIACLAAAPIAFAAATVATCWWYERVWLPRIAGEA